MKSYEESRCDPEPLGGLRLANVTHPSGGRACKAFVAEINSLRRVACPNRGVRFSSDR